MQIAADIKKKKLEWIRRVVKTDQGRIVKKITESKQEGRRRRRGRPRLKSMEDVERHLREMATEGNRCERMGFRN